MPSDVGGVLSATDVKIMFFTVLYIQYRHKLNNKSIDYVTVSKYRDRIHYNTTYLN